MDKNLLSRALYALPDGIVVRRRKPLHMPLLLLGAGGGLMAVKKVLAGADLSNLKSALVFVGGTLLLVGAIWLLVRLGSAQGAPYHRPSKSFLRFEELYFDRSLQNEVLGRIEAGDLEGLLRLPRQTIPALAVMLCRTRDNRLAACQAFTYAELEYKPLCKLSVMDKT